MMVVVEVVVGMIKKKKTKEHLTATLYLGDSASE
jgi:hypothetical protein